MSMTLAKTRSSFVLQCKQAFADYIDYLQTKERMEAHKAYFRNTAAGNTASFPVPDYGTISVSKPVPERRQTELVLDETKLTDELRNQLLLCGALRPEEKIMTARAARVEFILNV